MSHRVKNLILWVILLVQIPVSCKSIQKNSADCNENINSECMCTMEYRPVCGCNQKTYANPCMAACANIHQFTEGPCPR